jgi:sec-independent protein translocase protein TatB
MFDIGAPEFLVLIVFAVILFGPEKLPELARKAARVIHYVRNIAGNAQQQLGRELGPGFEDLDVRDLNPKAFIQKHLLSDVEPIMADVKSELADAKTMGTAAKRDVASAIEGAKGLSAGGPADLMAAATPSSRVLTPFDMDAT